MIRLMIEQFSFPMILACCGFAMKGKYTISSPRGEQMFTALEGISFEILKINRTVLSKNPHVVNVIGVRVHEDFFFIFLTITIRWKREKYSIDSIIDDFYWIIRKSCKYVVNLYVVLDVVGVEVVHRVCKKLSSNHHQAILLAQLNKSKIDSRYLLTKYVFLSRLEAVVGVWIISLKMHKVSLH